MEANALLDCERCEAADNGGVQITLNIQAGEGLDGLMEHAANAHLHTQTHTYNITYIHQKGMKNFNQTRVEKRNMKGANSPKAFKIVLYLINILLVKLVYGCHLNITVLHPEIKKLQSFTHPPLPNLK